MEKQLHRMRFTPGPMSIKQPQKLPPRLWQKRLNFFALMWKKDARLSAFPSQTVCQHPAMSCVLLPGNSRAENRITVIDSANLSTGIGLLVIEAAIMAKNGHSASEIASVMETLKPNVRASFVVDTLTYLYRGGRCNAVAAMARRCLKAASKNRGRKRCYGCDKKIPRKDQFCYHVLCKRYGN